MKHDVLGTRPEPSKDFAGPFRRIWLFQHGGEGFSLRQLQTYYGEPGDEAESPPNFLEAYPRVALKELLTAVGEGRTLCICSNPLKALRGCASASVSDEAVELRYRIFPFYGTGLRMGCAKLLLRVVTLGQGRRRTMFECPTCKKSAAVLIFFEGWKCRTCQKLLYRSSAVMPQVRQTERLRELEAFLEQGRPKGVHEATMRKKRAEVARLMKALRYQGRRRASIIAEQYIVQWHWHDPSESQFTIEQYSTL